MVLLKVLGLIDFIAIMLGISFTIMSCLFNKDFNKKIERCTYKTVGNIVDIEKRKALKVGRRELERPQYSEFNCYEYECNLEKVKVWSDWGNMPGKFQIGQQVILYCNPDNPTEFYSHEESTKTVITVFKFVGIGMLALAIILTTIIILLLCK